MNSAGICLSEYWQDKVIAVKRKPHGIIAMKLVIPGQSTNIVSVYDPSRDAARRIQLDSFLTVIPDGEELVLAGDLNRRIGRERAGAERWHGG